MVAPPKRIPGAANMASVVRSMPAAKVTEQTSEGLRKALFESLDQLRNGKTSPLAANATARLAEQIVRTVELEMGIERLAHHLGKRGDSLLDILPPTVPLGRREDAAEIEISDAFREGDGGEDEPEDE